MKRQSAIGFLTVLVCPALPTAVAVVGLVLALAPAAQAELTGPGGIVCPTGVNPATGTNWKVGDTYHLVFVTSTARDATSTDIADYNDHVNAAAALSTLPGVKDVPWYVVGSTTGGTNAKDNALVSAPVYRLDGLPIASGYGDFWDGTIANGISLTESLGFFDGYVFTGGEFGLCTPFNEPLGSYFVHIGVSTSIDSTWLFHSGPGYLISYNVDQRPFYALSSPLTIVPEPATLALLGLGGGLALVRRRARKA